METFCRGYLVALDDLLLDIDQATDMPSLLAKIEESRASTLKTLAMIFGVGDLEPLPLSHETAP